jgi:hypothetical protein
MAENAEKRKIFPAQKHRHVYEFSPSGYDFDLRIYG